MGEMKSPIFVGGSGSSGTTLVKTILNSHPNIYCGKELNLFNSSFFYDYSFPFSEHLFRKKLDLELNIFKFSLKRYGLSIAEICMFAATSRFFIDFCNKIIEHSLNTSGKIRWAEKSPSNCRFIEQIIDMYPGAKYIHVVRDGRDVVLSLKKRGWSYTDALRRWLYDSMCGVRFRGKEFYYEIQYENLVKIPEKNISDLFDFLGEDVSVQDLMKARRKDKITGFTSWTTSPSANITDIGVCKWYSLPISIKKTLERDFKHVCLSKKASKQLGISENFSGNEALKYFEYDLNDNWNPSRSVDFFTFIMYLRSLVGDVLKRGDSNRNWSMKLY